MPVLFFEAEFSADAWRHISPDTIAVNLASDQPALVADRHSDVVRNPLTLAKMASTLRAQLAS